MTPVVDRPRLQVIDGHRTAYRCQGCGTVSHWHDGWRWYGTLDEPPEYYLCPACADDAVDDPRVGSAGVDL
jgi:hypothetical protein